MTMMWRCVLFVMMSLLAVVEVFAQSDLPEEVDGGGGVSKSDVSPNAGSDGDYYELMYGDYQLFAPGVTPDWTKPLRYQPFVFASNVNTVNAAGVARIAAWRGGGLVASGGRQSYEGLMGVERGALTALQRIGSVELSVSAEAEKVGYFRGLSTVYGVSGVMVWQFSDRMSLTLYGGYYSSNDFRGAAMMPYVSTSNFGGFLSWDFAEHIGVDVGAQTRYNSYSRRWDTLPIVRPYYKAGNGAKIGIDVGGLVYGIYDSHRSRRSNPTIGPPIQMGAPPVRPNR